MAPIGTQQEHQSPVLVGGSNRDWSRAYWAVLVNQVLVIGIMGFLAAAMLSESYRACEAASLYLPGFTEWYLMAVGPAGLALAGLVSVAISFAMVGLRRKVLAVIVSSASFAGGILFLAGGFFSSLAPLLVAIRDMLPPDQKW